MPASEHPLTESQSNALVARAHARKSFAVKRCLHEIFEEQVRRTPNAIALTCEGASMTYGELNRRANQLAHAVRAQGIGAEALVALYVERSLDMVVGVLGILKAGAAYLPIDPAYPTERIDFMISDSGVALILTDRAMQERLPAAKALVLCIDNAMALSAQPDTNPASGTRPEGLAYVIYTSGSTGKPKGCLIEHRNVVRLFSATDAWFGFTAQDVWTLFHSIAFDFTVWELWGALLHGGRLVVIPYDLSRSPERFYELLVRERVTVLNQTPSAFQMLMRAEEKAAQRDLALRYVIFGGEALEFQSLRPWMTRHGDRKPQLINMYGITETTVHVTYRPLLLADLDTDVGSVIGEPIPDLGFYILDPEQRPVATGTAGEIYVGGAGVARGYLQRPELSAEKFIDSPWRAGDRLYRSGDLARARADGNIEYLGRIDQQVKIRGFRIELGEIQSQLARHPSVRSAVVVARDDKGEKRLIAYVVPQNGPAPAPSALREHLATVLPEYMLPTRFVNITNLPLTANGKIDQHALPALSRDRPELEQSYVAPRTAAEAHICATFVELLEVEPVGIGDNFFHLGGTSLLSIRALSLLRERHSLDIPVARFFQGPTALELARFLDGGHTEPSRHQRQAARRNGTAARGGIAIVGMAGRFPGAGDIETFWANLCGGIESLRNFSEGDLHSSVSTVERSDPAYVRVRGVLDGFDQFDAGFFGITPKEAEMMDPQQRIFLEISWEALEHAGYPPASYHGAIAVFAGMYGNTYLTKHLATRPDLIERTGALHTLILNEKDFIATRVAHKLDLTGPAISVHTACSTSLVAICQAVQSLRSGESDMALAGGASMTCPPASGYVYQEGGMLSVDGHTRSFDAKATGTVFSDGAGVVLLRRIEDAQAAGDTIYAVIRGAASNNDGGRRASFTAPSVDGQTAVIAMAQENAGVDARSISYIETHGTATPLGDPIEIEALTQAFRRHTEDQQFCGIGSLKSNVGHLVAAAGVAGVIKTALALHNKRIPPSLHFESPNPKLDLANSPFFVAERLTDWPLGATVRRAGVSSFGVGGTNAHVVLEEAPQPELSSPSRPHQLLVLSARSAAALERATANLAGHLEAHPQINLADAAYTLQVGRKAYAHRRALVVSDTQNALALLRAGDVLRVTTRAAGSAAPQVAFMFPGQGAQYVAMGQTLYRDDAVFRAIVDHCAEVLKAHAGFDLRAALYETADADAASAALQATSLTQPALFTIEYALAQLWLGLGVHPTALIGHSVGEFVAATLAGVFSLEDALRLVATRGRLMQDLPRGSMLSVRLPALKLAERLTTNLVIASDNGPQLAVAAGPTEEVIALQATLEGEGIACRLLQTSHAFHSAMMDPVLAPFGEVLRRIKLSTPAIPVVSTVTGTWMTPEQALDPQYWTQQLRQTVRFAPAVRTLLENKAWLLLEVGPRATLGTLARQQAASLKPVVIASLCDAPENEWDALLQSVGQVWSAGVAIDWTAFSGDQRRRRIPLPTYPFERQRYWVEPLAGAPVTVPALPVADALTASVEAAAFPAALSYPLIPEVPSMNPTATSASVTDRKGRLLSRLRVMFEEVSGVEMDDVESAATFLELGLDSLALTQVALQLQKTFGIKVTFRQLMQDFPNLDKLAAYMDGQIPPEAAAAAAVPPAVAASPAAQRIAHSAAVAGAPSSYLKQVVDTQLQLMAQQLALLGGAPLAPSAASPAAIVATPVLPRTLAIDPLGGAPAAQDEETASGPVQYDVKKAFGAIARIQAQTTESLTPVQRTRLDAFIRRYNAKTQGSKKFTQDNRRIMADPRAVTGFKPAIKELVYPIVVDRSKGSHLWDIDGNEYVDVLCGFGPCMFGWQPEFVIKALQAQMERGFETGPQHPLQAIVAQQICDMTGFERAAFCNTGSEAVMGCMRVARTVTGRNLIAIFSGSYHGIFDEVIVRGTRKLRSVPAAPGIMPSATQNVLVLDYGTPQSLEILKSRADELAAIMVEPVQSRRPDFQPREFLHELRALTEQSGSLYIFDEVVTGFRSCPGGAQEFFGLQADLASYGKVIGGGLPIGVVAGKAKFMDALDGGFWQYGDDSTPPVGVTYFAGTFVRHPLALAAAHAVLTYLKQQGPELQRNLNQRTAHFVADLNAFAARVNAPIKVTTFSSLWRAVWESDQPFGDLLCFMMRDRGVHLYDGFPCFFTTAHTEADFAHITKAFKESLVELQEGGFIPGRRPANRSVALDPNAPPAPGARLGRDQDGNPAWFLPNPDKPGKFMRLEA